MAAESSIKDGFTQFSMDLYDKIVTMQQDNLKNTIFSPMSLYSAMLLAMAGTSGSALQEMSRTLQLSTQQLDNDTHGLIGSLITRCFQGSAEVQLSLANRLFLLRPVTILDSYIQLVNKYYKATAEVLDSLSDQEAKRKHINKWVAKNTKDKITELIPSGAIDSNTMLALVNALYFRGLWDKPFNKAATHTADFKLLDGTSTKVQTMFDHADYEMAELPDLNSVAVKLPFRGTNWEMLIVLPNETDGLPNLIEHLSKPGTLKTLMTNTYYKEDINLFLPKFKLGKGDRLNAKSLLQQCGMKQIFTPDADMSKLSSQTQLSLSEVLHEAILEVDEEGATAAAATGGMMLMCASIPKVVRVDHPFFVALICEKNVPVFVGHVVKPEFD